jgi:DNA-binding MarR family transcriptional regulator
MPDPTDRRAKLVHPTERGHEVFPIAQELAELEARIRKVIGPDRADALRGDLEAIRRDAALLAREPGASLRIRASDSR